MTSATDTIFALATPPGRSGVAVVRISGRDLGPSFAGLGVTPPAPRLATLAALRHGSGGEVIDRALLLHFPAPHSFTGEAVLECQCHGSPAVLAELFTCLAALPGHRAAEPGEFSRRAFAHGKLDLTEAEGLADLIDAETALQKRQAMRQMEGALSDVAERLRCGLLHTLAMLEACIDFPDEDIPAETLATADRELAELQREIDGYLADASYGERLREGYTVTVLGVPNAGKSSLINRLAGRDLAIVSPLPGTTRDLIEARLDLAGLPVILIDTAGLREQREAIEAEGIRRAVASAEQSDLRIILLDPTQPMASQRDSLVHARPNDLILLGKSDRPQDRYDDFAEAPPLSLSFSSATGKGLDELRKMLHERLLGGRSGSAIVTRARHRQCFLTASRQLATARSENAIELKCESTRSAAASLAEITGGFHVENLLDTIFASFCLGK